MKIAVFARKTEDSKGKKFYTYSTRLTKKDGSTESVGVAFREECGAPDPKKCPMNIVVDRKNANLAERHRQVTDRATGEVVERVFKTLWVSDWKEGEKYVDHSLDDYAD